MTHRIAVRYTDAMTTTMNTTTTTTTPTLEDRHARICAWLVTLGRKVTPDDITPERMGAAKWWLSRYAGSFEFLVDLQARGGIRTPGQAKGVLNCLRADLLRNAPAPERQQPTGPQINLRHLPAGRYAYQPADGQAQFLVVQKPDEGRWAGCIFVKSQHSDDLERAGFQGARQDTYRGTHIEALTAIARDPRGAMELYGQLIGACGHCGRTLTNEESREIGIGPVCRAAMGW